jgi:hypothetical protein
VLDVVLIDLLSANPKIGQPENWVLGQESWQIVGQRAISDLTSFIVEDPELFRGYDRFVSATDVQARPPESSLLLVKPQNLVWSVEKTHYGRRRIIGTFSTCGQSYTLPLTDEDYERQLSFIEMDRAHQHDSSVPIFLTLSLGDVWNETKRHYKLIAGVIT